MTDDTPSLAEQQRAYWNSPAGDKWVDNQSRLDAMFVPMTEVLLEYAEVKPGEKILDVGCGAGTTTRLLGARTGAGGEVLGVDISTAMLNAAKARGNDDHVRFFEGDAGTAEIFLSDADLIISRFGVMFFEDPVVAFSHMRKVLKPSGRLCFVCWGERSDNPWFRMPLDVIVARFGPLEPAAPRAPGPMAFAQVDYIHEFLGGAGFDNIVVDTRDVQLPGRDGPEDTAHFLMEFGPGARILATLDVDEATKQQLIEALAEQLQAFKVDGGVQVPAKLHFVRAANT